MYIYWLICLILLGLFKLVKLQCPTMGMSSYIIVSITPNVTDDVFKDMIDFYGVIAAKCGSGYNHEIHFGYQKIRTITSDEFPTFWEHNDINMLYTAALVVDTDFEQKGNEKLSNTADTILKIIDAHNHIPSKLVHKKTITIITDYINTDIVAAIPDLKKLNAEAYVFSVNSDVINFIGNDTRFTTCDLDVAKLDNCTFHFCDEIQLEYPSQIIPTTSQAAIYLGSFSSDLWMLKSIALQLASGALCSLRNSDIKQNYFHVHFMNSGKDFQIFLPWIGNVTEQFLDNCVNEQLFKYLHLPETTPSSNDDNIPSATLPCLQDQFFYHNLYNDLRNETFANGSFIFFDKFPSDCLQTILTNLTEIEPEFQILFNVESKDDRNTIYTTFNTVVYPIFGNKSPHFHVNFVNNSDDIDSAIVVCQNQTHQKNLTIAEKYHYLEPMAVALDQFFIIIALCSMSAISVGGFFYRLIKKQHKENITDAELEYKTPVKTFLKKENNARMDALPWEVHVDRIMINYEFPLGEGNSYVIYLGKLRGKAPIMQWANLGEMKQFQDCAVAVRVPRRFDDNEEQQLMREINAVRILKHHDYIANLLGWVNKNNFACTILELTHTNLLKYVTQLKDGFHGCPDESICILPLKHCLRIIIQICDAMGYIASKGLVHRDLAARNVLLTTGLRAKISGLNYCSYVGDENFEPMKPAFRQLPLHWMALEAMNLGKFCESSDVWSFSMLLYEIYSLGEIPMGHIKDAALFKALKVGERPEQPHQASDEIYEIMTRCWHRYAERRPNFLELHGQFETILERQYDNPAFEFENPNCLNPETFVINGNHMLINATNWVIKLRVLFDHSYRRILSVFVGFMVFFQSLMLKVVDKTLGTNMEASMLVSAHVKTSEFNFLVPNKFLENFDHLPSEILSRIFSNLPASNIQNVASTCRLFHQIVLRNRLQLNSDSLDALDVVYSKEKELKFAKPGSNDGVGIFQGQRQQRYNGDDFNVCNYQIVVLNCQFYSFDEEVLQKLKMNLINAKRVEIQFDFEESEKTKDLLPILVSQIQNNSSIKKATIKTAKSMIHYRKFLAEAMQCSNNKLILR
uniref:Protein kinase domain-containing protein n=1 Tax=Panagrolaimus sp. JU765 TaxID=591449 RepID=A0AC34PW39_9BILA